MNLYSYHSKQSRVNKTITQTHAYFSCSYLQSQYSFLRYSSTFSGIKVSSSTLPFPSSLDMALPTSLLMKFFQGNNVKLTFNTSTASSNASRITFKEIITPSSNNWDFILLSSYCTDYEWLLNQFHGISPNCEINVIEHYDRTQQNAGIQQVKSKSGRIVNLIHPKFPKFPSYGVMHCKLIILASSEFLRIVVSSANLMDYDYEEVQNVYFQSYIIILLIYYF